MTPSSKPHPEPDGIHALPPRERMTPCAIKRRDLYARKPGAPFLHREFWLMSVTMDRWQREDGLDPNANLQELFQLDPPGHLVLSGLGWCESAFLPAFEVKQIEDRGEREVIQDTAGRHVLVFKGRREGFMPDYLDHPVKDLHTWNEQVKWRLNQDTPGRFDELETRMKNAVEAAGCGLMICQQLVGGYMYLRSLIGPEGLLYAVYDQPGLIHDCMDAWLKLADAVIARHQQYVTLDEFFMAEDICYNHGLLISPDMMREFLFPYYRELISRVRTRQLDPSRHLYIQVDTDGLADPAIPVYREIGLDVMCPFEVASGSDVVKLGRQWPELAMSGGIDKRVLARGPAAIDRMVEGILPVMRRRGGYTPTVDHGVPPETPLANYLHYRRRCVELGG